MKSKKKSTKGKPIKLIDPKKQMRQFATEILPRPKGSIPVAVKIPCDLRASVDMKRQECSPYAAWTAFVNNAGNLIHIMHRKQGAYVRWKLEYHVKNRPDNSIAEVVSMFLESLLSG